MQVVWIWVLWLFSQAWITVHIWTPHSFRLAPTEKLFVTPMYNALLIDQSLVLNRRRDDQPDATAEVGGFGRLWGGGWSIGEDGVVGMLWATLIDAKRVRHVHCLYQICERVIRASLQ